MNCANCRVPAPTGARPSATGKPYVCREFGCRAAMLPCTVTKLYSKLTPAARDALGCFTVNSRGSVRIASKDMDRVQAAVQACTEAAARAREELARERKFNTHVIMAAILMPGDKEGMHPHMYPVPLTDQFPAFRMALNHGMAAAAAVRPRITNLTELTMENASVFVEEASRMRKFTELVSTFVSALRAPAHMHFHAADEHDFEQLVTDYCQYSLDVVLAVVTKEALERYAVRVARSFLEQTYARDGPVTVAWPWLAQPLRGGDMLATLSEVHRPLDAFYVRKFVERFTVSRGEARPWTRQNHLEVARPWALEAVPILLLVLYRHLGPVIADSLVDHIIALM